MDLTQAINKKPITPSLFSGKEMHFKPQRRSGAEEMQRKMIKVFSVCLRISVVKNYGPVKYKGKK
jgi:hypothetical protein